LASPSGTAFSNFSWALYGLASGGNSYNYIFQKHPEVLLLQDPVQSQTIYRMAFDLILHKPGLFIEGAIHHWVYFFSKSWYSAFSFLYSENSTIDMVVRWLIYSLCVLGFIKWVRKPSDPYSGLAVMSALGVLISVPFVPPTDAYRVRLYAASITIFALLPGMGLSFILQQIKVKLFSQPSPALQESNITAVFSALLITSILGGTLLTKGLSHPSPSFEVICPEDSNKVAVRFDAGSSINILPEKDLFLDWMPNFHKGLFNRNIHSLADTYLIHFLESLPPYISIFSSLDYLSGQQALIIIYTDQLPQPGTDIGICGHWERDPNLERYGIFYGTELSR
jgi:hypothetical protein